MVWPYFFYRKTDALWKVMTFFSRRLSSPLPSSHFVYPVFFLNSATKKLILFGCHPLNGVIRGGPPLPFPIVTSLPYCFYFLAKSVHDTLKSLATKKQCFKKKYNSTSELLFFNFHFRLCCR